MNRKAEETARRYGMFPPGAPVVAAVSGGADSMAMLHWLIHRPQRAEITVCHLNHCLRGEESDRDQAFVEDFCRVNHLPCRVRRAEIRAIAQDQSLGIEEAARQVRYAFFEETARELSQAAGCEAVICTAHTLSDRVETMLFHLARGSSAAGLCSIPPVRGRIVRPLLGCTRREIEDYCREHGLAYCTDSTNRDTVYSRNKIRLEVVPALERINSEFTPHAGAAMEDLSEDEEYLRELARQELLKAKTEAGFSARPLAQLPSPILRRAAALLLEEWNAEKKRERIAGLCKIIRQNCGTLNLTGNRQVRLQAGILTLELPPEEYFEVPVEEGALIRIAGHCLFVQGFDKENFVELQKIHKNRFHYWMDCDKIRDNLVLRQKKPGDRISLSRRGVTKSLKKLFGEQRLTVWERSRIPVLADSAGPLAAGSFGMDERVSPTPDTRRFLGVWIGREEEALADWEAIGEKGMDIG